MQLRRNTAAKHRCGVNYFFVMTLRGTLSATTSMRPAVGSVARILAGKNKFKDNSYSYETASHQCANYREKRHL